MTLIPFPPDAKGRGAAAEEEDLRDPYQISHVTGYSTEEDDLYNKASGFLGGEFDERILRDVVRSALVSRTVANPANILNEVLGAYFDRIDTLKDRQAKQVRFEEHPESPSSTKHSPVSPASRQVKTADRASDVIDISSEEDKKQWEISDNREEQDMAKAIEASLKENQNIPGFSPVAQKDPENPYERLRLEGVPVGLKNIGNSCWFNVIIQTLFNIPAFRKMLLEFEYPRAGLATVPCGDRLSSLAQINVTKPIGFIIALRDLFAFLLASKRNYIDPTETINVVNDLATTLLKAVPCVGIQQDCMEMLLRFTEWLEKGFEEPCVEGNNSFTTKLVRSSSPDATFQDKGVALVTLGPSDKATVEDMDQTVKEGFLMNDAKASGKLHGSEKPVALESSTCPESDDSRSLTTVVKSESDINFNNQINPFTAMFHGSHVELRNSRVDSSAGLKNKFQLINLDVSFGNLHDSFEAYHLSSFPTHELWYETAPPVIVFSLVRFSYKNGKTEKIHSRFHFPRSFYLDRYLIKNREYVLENRTKQANLKKKRLAISKELDRMLKFPVGNSYESQPNIIGAVIKLMDVESRHPCAEIEDAEPMEIGEEPTLSSNTCSSDTIAVAPKNSDAQNLPASGAGDDNTHLSERSGYNGQELMSVTKFLRNLASDVQSKLSALQSEVSSLNMQIETIFDVNSMKEECYRLHSVIIHEGEANVGHYWAYIADYSSLGEDSMASRWRKYNDKSVEPATYEQMEEDAYGSKRTCSAYCIVYTRCKSETALFGSEVSDPFLSVGSTDQLVQLLPSELGHKVSEDNDKLNEELRVWDTQQNVEVAGACSCPQICDFADIANDQEMKLMLDENWRKRSNCESIAHYYRFAYNIYGTVMVKKAVEHLGQGFPDGNASGREEITTKLFEEVFPKCVKGMQDVDNEEFDVDCRVLLTEWTHLNGIPLSELAIKIFMLRMLSVDSPQDLTGTYFSRFSSICLETIKTFATKFQGFKEAEHELLRVYTLYELYCYAIGVLAEAARQIWEHRGTRELNRDVQQAKLVCFSGWLLEKYRFYCHAAGGSCANPEVDLVLIAVMIISSVHVSQDLVEYLSDTTNDQVLDANKAFLAKEYRMLLHRIRKYDCDSNLSVRLMTVQYVMSLWEYLQRRLNSSKVTAILEMLHEAESCDIRYDDLPVSSSTSSYDILEDRRSIAEFVSQGALGEPNNMQLLLKTAAAGAKINSLQNLPEEQKNSSGLAMSTGYF
ncbi:unnamed protein product [Enterobius vermicularis]|uniref:USP domain-containing protein n=1 Tax=Enterobius vermicularis TaxID=51028 RepID=A0A0N4UXD4_ENTVE|nr:unnamed protein product [Enterobius vermicularis]